MKILYGLCGEGFGHSSRAKTIIPYLEKLGHTVKVMTYGQALDVLENNFDVFPISGLHIEFRDNRVQKTDTIKKGLETIFKNIKNNSDFYNLMKNKFDLCITDMEPVTGILSFWHNIPLISIDNQHRMTNLELEIPKKYQKDFLIAKGVTKIFCSKARHFIVTSFSEDKIRKKYAHNTTIVPPIIRSEVQNLKPKTEKYFLVYSTKPNEKLINELKNINQKFIVYGWNKKEKDSNIEYFPKGKSFLRHLNNCKAIIATAGFTLISEALYLKKPYYALPLHGQFEQVLNGLFLRKSKYGDFSDVFSSKKIEKFITNIDKYKKELEKNNLNQEILFSTIDNVLKEIL